MCEKFRASHFLKQIRFCENLRSLLFSYGKVLLTGHCDPDSGSLPFAAGRTESENDGCRVSGTVRTDRSAVGCELFLKKCRKSVLRASNFCGCTLQEGCVVFSNTRKKCSFFPVKLSDSKKNFAVAGGNGIYHHRFPAQGIGFCKNMSFIHISQNALISPEINVFYIYASG